MVRAYAPWDVAAPHPEIQLAAREAILGTRRGWRALLPFLRLHPGLAPVAICGSGGSRLISATRHADRPPKQNGR